MSILEKLHKQTPSVQVSSLETKIEYATIDTTVLSQLQRTAVQIADDYKIIRLKNLKIPFQQIQEWNYVKGLWKEYGGGLLYLRDHFSPRFWQCVQASAYSLGAEPSKMLSILQHFGSEVYRKMRYFVHLGNARLEYYSLSRNADKLYMHAQRCLESINTTSQHRTLAYNKDVATETIGKIAQNITAYQKWEKELRQFHRLRSKESPQDIESK